MSSRIEYRLTLPNHKWPGACHQTVLDDQSRWLRCNKPCAAVVHAGGADARYNVCEDHVPDRLRSQFEQLRNAAKKGQAE